MINGILNYVLEKEMDLCDIKISNNPSRVIFEYSTTKVKKDYGGLPY